MRHVLLVLALWMRPSAGKYESIAMGDAFHCDDGNPLLMRGGPGNSALVK